MTSQDSKLPFIGAAFRHHRIVLLIVSALLLVGMYGLIMMPKQEIPTITIRQGLVVAVCPGYTAESAEERVAKPLENFIFGYNEVDKSKTYSVSKEGLVLVYVELREDVNDRDAFWSKFKHGLSGVKATLPRSVLALQAIDDIGDTSALLITISSKEKTRRELQRYAEALEDRLRPDEAISRMRLLGEQTEQITVSLDQARLSQYGIGSVSLLGQLSLQGFTTTAGSLDDHSAVTTLHVSDAFDSEQAIADYIIWSDATGRTLRLGDVAEIKREYATPDKDILYDGAPCVMLSVEMKKGYDITAMGNRVHALLDDFQKTLPDDVSVDIITDQSHVVGESVLNFITELLIAIISVIIVVVLLMPGRVAGVAAISIPVTIFISLALFYIFGIELNTVSLAALIVTLGMIVDDSVVIIDNYIEKLGMGLSREEATIAAPSEFFHSVLSATLSISVTFFPFLFTMRGPFRDFVSAFPWAMFIILGISLLISLLLTPYLQYRFIHKGIEPPKQPGRKTPLDYLQTGYDKLLRLCLSHRWVTLGVGVGTVVVGAMLFMATPKRLMPIAERNQLAVEIYMPEGTAAPRTAEVARKVAEELKKDHRVTSITTFIGQGSPRFHSTYAPQVGGTNFAQLIVNTDGISSTTALLDTYADAMAGQFPEAYVRFKQIDYSDAAYPIELRLSADSLQDLLAAGEMVKERMATVPGLKLIRTNYASTHPALSVTPREEEAARLGINSTLLTAQLALHFGNGTPLTTVWEGDYPVSVVMRAERTGGEDPVAVGDEYIAVSGGMKSVPLRQIADIETVWTRDQIVRRGGLRTLSVVAEPCRGENENDLTAQALRAIPTDSLPAGVKLSVGGMSEKDAHALPMVISGVAIAVLIIFAILIFHFGSIPLALINLASVGLCIFGAAAGLKILGMQLSLTAILGVVSLMGILVRNGIIMLDYAEELYHREGMSVHEAAFHAGSRRMRPIFLTSAAASVGVLPMIFENTALWTPMGTVIFFGTLISMVLISTVLPVVYDLAFRGRDKKRGQA